MEVEYSPGVRMGRPGWHGSGVATRDGCPLVLLPLQCQMDACSVVKDKGECTNDGLSGGYSGV